MTTATSSLKIHISFVNDVECYNSVGIFPVSLYFCLKAALSSSVSGTKGYKPARLRCHNTEFQNPCKCKMRFKKFCWLSLMKPLNMVEK